jgi:membrane protein DedA with SNARE-associated domain
MNAWQQANQAFQKGGGAAIFLTRWLLTSIAIPTNWVAGGCGYRFDRFLLYDLLGEATWIALFGGLGYWFGSQWEVVQQFLSDFGGLAMGVALLVAGIYLGIKGLSRRRASRSTKEIYDVYQDQSVCRPGHLRWIPGGF